MTVTKDRIINSIYNQVGLSRSRSKEVVEVLIEIIKNALENGDDVMISGFGKFSVREKKARRGRNPHTNESLQLRERRVVTFKLSGVLKNQIKSIRGE